jgi:hypothetical protein
MTNSRHRLALVVLILVLPVLTHAAEPSSTYFRDWLICGPIPLGGEHPVLGAAGHLQGFERNYFEAQGEEGAVRPQAGQKVVFPGGETVWKAWQSSANSVDLNTAVTKLDGLLAYAYTEFEAETSQAAVLAIGSNDGCRVWLNGERVFDYPAGRGLVPDSDLVPVLLQAGTNRLLFKIEDQGNAWGFACRVLPLGEKLLQKRLDFFAARQLKNDKAVLEYRAPKSLRKALVTEAAVKIQRDDGTGEVLWEGPWTGSPRMALPVDTSSFGKYIVTVDAILAGGLKSIFVQPFVAGTPVDRTVFAAGKSVYVIVVGDGASESEKWAAKELQKAIAAVGGVTLPIVTEAEAGDKPAIVVGWNGTIQTHTKAGTPPPAPDDESFTYRNVGPHILIYGGSQRGTMYGVMAFLEDELGVRYYTPAVTVTPQKAEYSFRLLHRTDGPGIRVRNDFYKEAFDPTWAAHNRVNGAMGTREQPGGVEGYWAVHTFFPLLSPAEFFESNPEYFSLIDGERIHERAQLCLTNPEVMDIITERLRQRMRDNPGNLIYSLSQNDWINPCQCDNCQAIAVKEESEMGPVLWFVNQVAERVEAEFPDKFVGTLAYQYTRKPPKHIKPRDNVVIRFCSIECCFAHDFTSCPENVSFVADLKGWAEIAPRIYVWDYVVSFSNYIMPFPNFSVLQPNIQTLRDHHAIGIMEQAAYQSRGGEFSELKAYLIAKLLWNPEAEVEPIIDDFMYGYYGRAGQYVREYFDLVQDLVTSDTHFPIWIKPEDPLYNATFIRDGERILDKAAAVADNPDILARVEMARLPLLYLKCKRSPREAFRDGSWDRLLAIKEREGVTHFAESGAATWDPFYKRMEHMREE